MLVPSSVPLSCARALTCRRARGRDGTISGTITHSDREFLTVRVRPGRGDVREANLTSPVYLSSLGHGRSLDYSSVVNAQHVS